MTKELAGAALVAAILVASTNLASQSTQQDSAGPDTSQTARSGLDRKPQKIYHVGGDVKAPRMISGSQPSLNEQQIKDMSRGKQEAQGSTIVKIIVGDDGTVRSATVLRSFNRDLDVKAIDTVKQWKFEPAQRKGVPVAVELAVEVDFHLYK